MPVELEPYRRLIRPVNRHDCMERVLRVVSNVADAAKAERS